MKISTLRIEHDEFIKLLKDYWVGDCLESHTISEIQYNGQAGGKQHPIYITFKAETIKKADKQTERLLKDIENSIEAEKNRYNK